MDKNLKDRDGFLVREKGRRGLQSLAAEVWFATLAIVVRLPTGGTTSWRLVIRAPASRAFFRMKMKQR
ncbi:MAG: hypothetical protein LBR26_02110 [Prevotella sp.]|jgi:hypothetical protein|nr:hypothetical protein [Prevotella sp.]